VNERCCPCVCVCVHVSVFVRASVCVHASAFVRASMCVHGGLTDFGKLSIVLAGSDSKIGQQQAPLLLGAPCRRRRPRRRLGRRQCGLTRPT
jgi:hypothetical protein